MRRAKDFGDVTIMAYSGRASCDPFEFFDIVLSPSVWAWLVYTFYRLGLISPEAIQALYLLVVAGDNGKADSSGPPRARGRVNAGRSR